VLRKMNFEIVPLASLDLTVIDWPRPARPTILVVDDEAVIADTLGRILEINGFRVNIAYDGISALKLSRTVLPDLLLTDVSMPGMSGIDLAIEMQRSLPNCKVLLFSGQASTSDLLGAARLAGRVYHSSETAPSNGTPEPSFRNITVTNIACRICIRA
jgi:CheY-like chemotaxis protein